MKLSIVTLHTDDKLIFNTLSSVYKSVKTPFEYILVDNNKNKERLEHIGKVFTNIKILQNPKNYGYARGINRGLREAKGEFVLALNPDILVFEETIDAMVQYMEQHKEIVIIGPKLLNADHSLQFSCRRYPKLSTIVFRRGILNQIFQKRKVEYEMHDFDHKEILDVDWMCGGFLLIRRDLFDKIGYFDEFFFLYFDDVDFCRRAKKIGRIVYYPLVEAIHSASYESKKKFVPFLIHIKSMIYYFIKHRFFSEYSLVKDKSK